jgi:hypothetical protein
LKTSSAAASAKSHAHDFPLAAASVPARQKLSSKAHTLDGSRRVAVLQMNPGAASALIADGMPSQNVFSAKEWCVFHLQKWGMVFEFDRY